MKKRFTVKSGSQFSGTGVESAELNDNPGGQIDLFTVAGYLLKHKRLIAIAVLAAIVVSGLICVMQPETYVSRASILPSGKTDKLDKLKELAGLGGSVAGDENSSTLFPVILRSNLILDAVIDKSYSFRRDGQTTTGTLRDYFQNQNQDLLRRSLVSMTDINEDIGTGVIYVSVISNSPRFSQALLQNYLDELEAYNLEKRQSRAKENVVYLERELKTGAEKLAQAEDNLEAYQMANRDWDITTDPEVIMSILRFRRDVEAKSKMHAFLMQQYEAAKLDAQKDTPIVCLLDSPSLPTIKSGPHIISTVLVSGLVALICSIMIVVGYESLKKRTRGPDHESYELFRNDLREAFPGSIRVVNRLRKTGKNEVSMIET
jgi:uncharacterized protein involved in exopolysaccharide biosynthesis